MSASGKRPDWQERPECGDDRASSEVDAEKVVRHRIDGHKAALEMADLLGSPEPLAPYVQETEHRLAEAEDILDEITPEDPSGD